MIELKNLAWYLPFYPVTNPFWLIELHSITPEADGERASFLFFT